MKHRHYCSCGAYLVCSQELDQCSIRHFDCPVCLDREIDKYMAAQFHVDHCLCDECVCACHGQRHELCPHNSKHINP